MGWFEHGGHRIYYEESGSGEPVLLLPGWAGSIDDLGALRAALASRYRVIAADLPGSGKSEPQPRDYTAGYYEEDARLMIALLEALDASPAHLMGYSDGGEYALLMAALRPEIARSIIAWGATGQFPDSEEMADEFETFIDDPAPWLQPYAEQMKAVYGEANARAMSQSWSRALRAIIRSGGDISRSRAGDIGCPALLIVGENDTMAPPALGSAMAEAIAGGTYVEVKDAGHAVHREQSDWLVETVTGWLAKR